MAAEAPHANKRAREDEESEGDEDDEVFIVDDEAEEGEEEEEVLDGKELSHARKEAEVLVSLRRAKAAFNELQDSIEDLLVRKSSSSSSSINKPVPKKQKVSPKTEALFAPANLPF